MTVQAIILGDCYFLINDVLIFKWNCNYFKYNEVGLTRSLGWHCHCLNVTDPIGDVVVVFASGDSITPSFLRQNFKKVTRVDGINPLVMKETPIMNIIEMLLYISVEVWSVKFELHS